MASAVISDSGDGRRELDVRGYDSWEAEKGSKFRSRKKTGPLGNSHSPLGRKERVLLQAPPDGTQL